MCVYQRKGNGENQNNQKGLHIKGKGDSEWMGINAMTCCVNFWDVLKAEANCVRMTSQDLCGADYIWQMRMRISWGFF